MTITFENDRDIMVYALGNIISYARVNQYIFLAQTIWWISSIIGLQQRLVDHIDKLRDRPEAGQCIPQVTGTVGQSQANQLIRRISATPRDNQEESRCGVDLQNIHPNRVFQIHNMIQDISDLELDSSESSRSSCLIEKTKQFIKNFQKERKAIRKPVSPLTRTRSGKVPEKPLTEKQRSRFQAIPREVIVQYLEDRK